MLGERPLAGHRLGRALEMVRAPGLIAFLSARTRAGRRRAESRFSGPRDWLRLVMLGVILSCMGAMGLVRPLTGIELPDYVPGTPAIFGGMMLALGIIRIGRQNIYGDWLFLALIFIVLGNIVALNHGALNSAWFVAFWGGQFLSAILRLWIAALTEVKEENPGWLTATGLIGAFCVTWISAGFLAGQEFDLDFVLSVDLLVFGIAVIGFGIYRRETFTT